MVFQGQLRVVGRGTAQQCGTLSILHPLGALNVAFEMKIDQKCFLPTASSAICGADGGTRTTCVASVGAAEVDGEANRAYDACHR